MEFLKVIIPRTTSKTNSSVGIYYGKLWNAIPKWWPTNTQSLHQNFLYDDNMGKHTDTHAHQSPVGVTFCINFRKKEKKIVSNWGNHFVLLFARNGNTAARELCIFIFNSEWWRLALKFRANGPRWKCNVLRAIVVKS